MAREAALAAAHAPSLLLATLRERVGKFYTALAGGTAGAIAGFLHQELRQRRQRDEYALAISSLGTIEAVGEAEVWWGRTKENTGQALVRIELRTPAGRVVSILHATTWQRENDTWLLTGETVEER